MIDTKSIRTKILELAMRGQLTEQLPEDGTAEELYQQIQAEKQELIKAGKIKKEKPLPEITEGEMPFEIPGSWKWVSVGDVCINIQYGSSKKSSETGIIPVIRMGNIQDGKIVYDKLVYTSDDNEIAKYPLEKGDLLFNRTNSMELVGKTGLYNGEQPAIYAGYLVRVTPLLLFPEYLNYCMQSKYYWDYCRIVRIDSNGQSNINAEKLKRFLFPLPPLAEQQRIVDRVQQAFTALDTIDELQTQYADNLTMLKSKLIDAAIQGKLTEQLPEDGTAEELYQQIQEEKQALIKAGKIKKEKPLPEIAENEIPFEIPANWKWVRLSNLARTIVDCPHSTPHYYEQRSDYVAIDTNCIDADGNITQWRYIDKDTYQVRISRLQPMYNDIVYTREGSICRAAIIPDNKAVCLGQRVMLIRCPDGVLPKYLKMFLMSPQTVKILTAMQRGIGALHVNVADVCNLLVPLPPKAEQERIIAKLDKLMPLCRRLKPNAQGTVNAKKRMGTPLKKAAKTKPCLAEQIKLL